MSLIKSSKSRTGKLISLGIFIALLFILGNFLYPNLLWDISFLKHEIFFNLENSNLDNTKVLEEIPRWKDCNIVLISLDTLRADRLGCYGYGREVSPNIDKFAEEAIVFKNAFANAFNTLPSHMSLFTSLYPPTHKINTIKGPQLSLDFITLPQILKREGYHTIWSGPLNDFHLGLQIGNERGIDEFYTSLFSRSRGFKSNLFSDILQNANGKFYLFMHSYINHAPYFYPPEFNTQFSDDNYSGRLPKNRHALIEKYFIRMNEDYESNPEGFLEKAEDIPSGLKKELIESLQFSDVVAFRNVLGKLHGNLPRRYMSQFLFYSSIVENITEEDITELSNKYDNGVYYVDYLFSSVLEGLKQKKLLDNTIIIVTADHGEELFEHKGFDHENFYDHTIHIPLIMKIPGIERKLEVKKLVQSIDTVPMILEILQIEKPGYIQGKNILSSTVKNNFVFGFSFGTMYIRSKKWKYIVSLDGEEKLCYLLGDPNEKNNLIDSTSIVVNKHKTKLKDELTKWKIRQF